MSQKKKKNSNYKTNVPKAAEEKKSAGHKGLKTALIITGVILLISVISIFFYLRGAYQPNDDALEQLRSDDLITVRQEDGQTVFAPKEATTGFIFYPGANVEHTAYAPMAAWMAREGIFCVLVDSPLNHAFMDVDAADDIIAANPQITNWYVGGPSLGGAIAAKYADQNADKLEGLIGLINDLKKKIGIKDTIREYVPDEADFLARLDEMVEQAFDDQCTGANPRYPLMSEIKQMYLNAYYGK